MNISSRQLQAIVEVAMHRSFTRAAAKMHVTQAGLSAMVAQLESQLGARLFERTTRSVVPTDAGARFVPVAQRLLGELASAVAETGRIASQTARVLRVGVTPFVAAAVMPGVLQRAAGVLPGIHIHVIDDEVNRIQARVADGLLDVAFGSFFETRSGVRRSTVLRAALSLVRPAGQARGRRADWRAIAGAVQIALPDDNPVQSAVDRQLHGLGVVPRERRVVNHIHTALALVAAGGGLAVLPSFVAAAVGQYPIEVLPLGAPARTMPVYRIVRAGRRDTPELATFVDCFVATALGLGYRSAARGPARSGR